MGQWADGAKLAEGESFNIDQDRAVVQIKCPQDEIIIKLNAELNKTYLGKVQRITDFGAFVEIMPGTDGLLHVSEIANHRVKDVRDELKEGEQVLVKVINIDPTGKIRLSRKALLNEEAATAAKK